MPIGIAEIDALAAARTGMSRSDLLPSVMRLILPVIAFALWITEADRPPFKRATFETFPACVAAGQAQIERLRRLSPAIRWECLPE
jgi:hypothetical protein